MKDSKGKQTILVTGAAGFIGHAVAAKLLASDHAVIGVDNLNDYYSVGLKKARLAELQNHPNFIWQQGSILDAASMRELLEKYSVERVIHLAAQPGVRYSIENPQLYIDTNITGFLNVLEACRHHPVKHLIYASSSSVYGANTSMPYRADAPADHPVSLYAATKKAGEALAHSYSSMYGIPMSGLRFFTVYGPWGRPDMAYFRFARAMLKGEQISLYNQGDMKRDFTYVDDIVEGIVRLLDMPPQKAGASTLDHSAAAAHRIYNIGNHTPEPLMKLVSLLEKEFNCKANIQLLPMQTGDVYATWADVEPLSQMTGFSPRTSLKTGIHRFAEWLKAHPQFM